ncbi:hypothetical protein ACPROK_17500 [Glutamicibacter soli]|uniref:hypothetical protein n=1 Tax=Micrococcaceae TaxID=1268 RepID=UPI00069BE3A5|nr:MULTISPECIES: hypothetical protein [unclassified Arthrobacter]ALQ32136.1 hypothetical protein ATC04_17430 [Arthrobacter sp. YC-RL1]RKS12804.1 hypothetical protein DFO58_3661 [Arthrobacter sp. AG1021]
MTEIKKSAWGRMRSGGNTRTLLLLSFGGGLAAALGVAALVAAAGPEERFLATLLAFGFSFWLPFSALLWVLLVDRGTMRDAPRNVEDSVEYRWSERASAGVFRDMLVLLGAGAAVLSVLEVAIDLTLRWPLHLVLAGLVVLAMVDFGIRMQLSKRAEG